METDTNNNFVPSAKTSIKEINCVKYVEIDLSTEIQKLLDNAADANEERRIMYEYIFKNLRGKYPASDGRIVEINKRSAKEMTFQAPIVRLRAAPELAALIEIGQIIDLVDVSGHNIYERFAYYDVIFKIGNAWYNGRLNVGIRKNGESALYTINPFRQIASHEEEKAGPPIGVSKIQAYDPATRINDPAFSEINGSIPAMADVKSPAITP